MTRSRALASIAFAITILFGGAVGGSSGTPAQRATQRDDRATIVVRIVDESGRPLASRVRIERIRPGFRDRVLEVALADESPATFRMSESRVRVVATHGPEWSIGAREVDTKRGRATEVRLTLVRYVDRAPFVSADLHVHTDASPDGSISLEDRLRQVAAEDLDHIVFTDHNRLTRAPSHDGVAMTGVEITTTSPEMGHFNAFPIERVPTFRNTTAQRIFEDVHSDEGALVQINHPRIDQHIAYFELAGLTDDGRVDATFSLEADLLEVWNGYDLARRSRLDDVFEDWLRLRRLGHRMVATGGSDSHGISGPTLGLPRTYVRPRAGETFVEALRRGAAFVSNGPILDVRVGAAGPGDVVPLDQRGRVGIDVVVRASPYVDIRRIDFFRGTQLVRTVSLAASTRPVRHRGRTFLDVAPGDEIVVRVSGDRSMDDLAGRPDVEPCAFTNPIRFLSSTSNTP